MFVYLRSGKFYKKLNIVIFGGRELQQWEPQEERTLCIISFSNMKFKFQNAVIKPRIRLTSIPSKAINMDSKMQENFKDSMCI